MDITLFSIVALKIPIFH